MSLSEKLIAAAKPRLATTESSELMVAEKGRFLKLGISEDTIAVHTRIGAVNSFGVLFNRLSLKAIGREVLSFPRLVALAEGMAAASECLHFPLVIFERLPGRGQVILRSCAPEQTEDGLCYYEMALHEDGYAGLWRFHWSEASYSRHKVHGTMDTGRFARLIDSSAAVLRGLS